MRVAFVLPLALAIACSSSLSPDSDSLTGTWNATPATLPGSIQHFQVTLSQSGDSLTGTATLTPIGSGPTLSFQVAGRTGLNGASCSIDVVFDCHAQFEFRATATNGDFVNFIGGYTAKDKIVGDVFGYYGFENVDGRELDFTR
jgi:hypothetical protein